MRSSLCSLMLRQRHCWLRLWRHCLLLLRLRRHCLLLLQAVVPRDVLHRLRRASLMQECHRPLRVLWLLHVAVRDPAQLLLLRRRLDVLLHVLLLRYLRCALVRLLWPSRVLLPLVLVLPVTLT